MRSGPLHPVPPAPQADSCAGPAAAVGIVRPRRGRAACPVIQPHTRRHTVCRASRPHRRRCCWRPPAHMRLCPPHSTACCAMVPQQVLLCGTSGPACARVPGGSPHPGADWGWLIVGQCPQDCRGSSALGFSLIISPVFGILSLFLQFLLISSFVLCPDVVRVFLVSLNTVFQQ